MFPPHTLGNRRERPNGKLTNGGGGTMSDGRGATGTGRSARPSAERCATSTGAIGCRRDRMHSSQLPWWLLALVEVDLVRPDDRRHDPRVAGGERLRVLQLRDRVARRHLARCPRETKIQPSVPSKLDAVRASRRSRSCARRSRTTASVLKRAVHVPQALLSGTRASPRDLDRPRVLGVHRPVGAVDVVRAPAGDHAAPNCSQPQPARAGRSRPAGARASRCSRRSGVEPSHVLVVEVLSGRASPARRPRQGSPGRPTCTVFSWPMRPLRTSSAA